MHSYEIALEDWWVPADEVVGGHPPVLERDLVRVHAAVADRVDRATLHLAESVAAFDRYGILGELEAVGVTARLGHDEQAQSAMALRPVGVGAGEEREGVGAGTERAPGLDTVDDVAVLAVGAGGRGGGHLE